MRARTGSCWESSVLSVWTGAKQRAFVRGIMLSPALRLLSLHECRNGIKKPERQRYASRKG